MLRHAVGQLISLIRILKHGGGQIPSKGLVDDGDGCGGDGGHQNGRIVDVGHFDGDDIGNPQLETVGGRDFDIERAHVFVGGGTAEACGLCIEGEPSGQLGASQLSRGQGECIIPSRVDIGKGIGIQLQGECRILGDGLILDRCCQEGSMVDSLDLEGKGRRGRQRGVVVIGCRHRDGQGTGITNLRGSREGTGYGVKGQPGGGSAIYPGDVGLVGQQGARIFIEKGVGG